MSSIQKRPQMHSFSVSMCLYSKCFFKDGRGTSVFSCHRVRSGATEEPDCLSRWISSMRCHTKKNSIFPFCFWAIEDVIVSLCDNWPPPPCSRLHHSLQCCSLLNYYQWVWRDTCSLSSHYLLRDSLSHSISVFLSHTHMHVSRRSAYISFDMDLQNIMRKPDEIYIVQATSGAGRCVHVHVHAWWE